MSNFVGQSWRTKLRLYRQRMQNKFIFIAGVFGILAVTLGAFGAHALKALLPAEQLSAYQTGISYHFYHCLAMLGIAISPEKTRNSLGLPFLLFMIGICLFSGSLYWITLAKADVVPMFGLVGPLTPVGGLFFVAGWTILAFQGMKKSA